MCLLLVLRCHMYADVEHDLHRRPTDLQGQTLHWCTHKKYCKNLGAFCASRTFSQLASHEQIDALLLTHLLAECAAGKEGDAGLSIFMSLLPGPGGDTPPSCPLVTGQRPLQSTPELFLRCGNNNFSIHSHLTTIAHGVFPLASRLFNHSCVPNAVPKYRLARAKPVVMEVVAIRDIDPGEEVYCFRFYTHVRSQAGPKDMHSVCRSCTLGDPPADISIHIWFHVHVSFMYSAQATRHVHHCPRPGRAQVPWTVSC